MNNRSNSPSENREHATKIVDDALAHARRGRGQSVTVVAIEFDDLETLRAHLDHAGVRELLTVVGERFAQLSGVECAQTGDAFVLVSTVPSSVFDAFSLADRIVRMVSRDLAVGAFEISLEASVGVALSLGGTTQSRLLLGDARFALEEAKRRGRGQVVVLSPEFHRRRGDQRAKFVMRFDPIVSLSDGSVSIYEAMVLPGPVAGFDDADPATFEFLLDELARAVTLWPTDIDVAFNVSASQLHDDLFGERVVAVADRYSLERDRFVFEIDALHASEEILAVQPVVARLRDDGWRIGVHGFSAASSLVSALALLPVQYVKIDRSIVGDADPRIWDLLSISAAARSLEISTIATGITNLPDLALALAHEHDFAQGPLFRAEQSGPLAPRP